MSNPSRTLTVGLLWHSFSSDNLGVGALSESQVEIMEAAAKTHGILLRFIVFGTAGARNYAPRERAIEFAPPLSVRALLKGHSPFLACLRKCDLVLDIGEGDSFTDIYGAKRFRRQVFSKLAVFFVNKPLVLSPQTIGPFDGLISRWFATFIMRRCLRVFSRDRLSTDYLRTLGLEDNTEEAIDVAFRLPYCKSPRTAPSKYRVGINVSGLLFFGGYEGENQFVLTLDYPLLVRRLLEVWSADDRNEVWLVPHVLSDSLPRDDDRRAISALCSEFPSVQRAPDFQSPSEAKTFIASLDFLTGARMHACIAALSAGVAVYPVAYSRKFNGLLSSLRYPWLADGKKMNTNDAVNAILDGFGQRDRLAMDATLCAAEVDKRLSGYQDFLADTFDALATVRS